MLFHPPNPNCCPPFAMGVCGCEAGADELRTRLGSLGCSPDEKNVRWLLTSLEPHSPCAEPSCERCQATAQLCPPAILPATGGGDAGLAPGRRAGVVPAVEAISVGYMGKLTTVSSLGLEISDTATSRQELLSGGNISSSAATQTTAALAVGAVATSAETTGAASTSGVAAVAAQAQAQAVQGGGSSQTATGTAASGLDAEGLTVQGALGGSTTSGLEAGVAVPKCAGVEIEWEEGWETAEWSYVNGYRYVPVDGETSPFPAGYYFEGGNRLEDLSITFNGGLYAQMDSEGNLYVTYVYRGVLIVRRLLSGSDTWESILSEDWSSVGIVFREPSMIITPQDQLYISVAAGETASFDPSASDGQGVYLFFNRNPDSHSAKSAWSSQHVGGQTTNCHYPMVTSDEAGMAHLTWHGHLEGELFQVFYATTASIGRVLTISGEPPKTVEGELLTEGQAIFPSIVVWDGTAIIAWKFGNPSPGIGEGGEENDSLLYYSIAENYESSFGLLPSFDNQHELLFENNLGRTVSSTSHDPALWTDKQSPPYFWMAIHGEEQGTISVRSFDVGRGADDAFGVSGALFQVSDTSKNNFAHSSANTQYSLTVWTAFSDALGEIDMYGCFGCTSTDPKQWKTIDDGIAQVSDRIEKFESSMGETAFVGSLYAPISQAADSYLMSSLRMPSSDAEKLVGKNIVVETGFRVGRFKILSYRDGGFELELIATPNNLADGAVTEDIELNEYRTTPYNDIILYRYGEVVEFYVADAIYGALQPTAVLSADNSIHIVWLEMVVPAKEDAKPSDEGGNKTDYVRFRYRRGKINQNFDSALARYL